MSRPTTDDGLTRREAIALGGVAGATLLLGPDALAAGPQPAQAGHDASDVDHLMWGARDLDEGVAFLEARTGVKAAFGGVHPNRGTRNALLSLGRSQYLEIISIDPAQPDARDQRTDEIRALTAPRLLTWAAGTRDIEAVERRVRAAGLETPGITAGSRRRPDGAILRWRTLAVAGADPDVIPFVIEWDPNSTHPAVDSPAGCTLRELRLEHPDPAAVNRVLDAMGLRARATPGRRARLTARVSTPKGELELS